MKPFRRILCFLLTALLLFGALSVSGAAAGESFLTIISLGDHARVTACSSIAGGTIDVPGTYNGLPVTEIAAKAFKGCSGISAIRLPASVTSVGANAFEDCYALASVTFAGNDCSIGEAAFRHCDSLTEITLPANTTVIPKEAFADCTALVSVSLPASLTVIGQEAFMNCRALTSLLIPAGVTAIGANAFLSCLHVTAYNVAAGNQAFRSTAGCLYTADGSTLIQYPCGSAATSFSVPAGTETIGNGAFRGCETLRSVTLPASLRTIEDYAFASCTSLQSVSLPSGVTTLGSLSFGYCSALTSITLPASLTSYESAFYQSGLRSVSISSGVSKISKRAFEKCASLQTVTIPASVRSIEMGAFDSCSSLTSLTIPDSVTSIERNAFQNCNSLRLTVPAGSYALNYAISNGIPYTVQGGSHPIDPEKYILGVWIETLPAKTEYRYRDNLDTTGLTLRVSYSDGSADLITNGFTCTPTYLHSRGDVPITVTYKDFSDTFTVHVKFSLIQYLIYYLLLGFIWGY